VTRKQKEPAKATYLDYSQRDLRQQLEHFQIDHPKGLEQPQMQWELELALQRDHRSMVLKHQSHQMPMVLEQHQRQKGLELQMELEPVLQTWTEKAVLQSHQL
jgi:hypothetical protein